MSNQLPPLPYDIMRPNPGEGESKQASQHFDMGLLREAVERVVLPHLDSILTAMVNEALGSGRNAQQARQYLLDRLFGKPTERQQVESSQSISISIVPYSPDSSQAVEGLVVREIPAVSQPTLPEPDPLKQAAEQVVDALIAKHLAEQAQAGADTEQAEAQGIESVPAKQPVKRGRGCKATKQPTIEVVECPPASEQPIERGFDL